MDYIELNRFLKLHVLQNEKIFYYYNLNTLDGTTDLIIKI